MSFVPLNKTRLFESVVNQIQEEIKKGVLIPGDKLPSERELSEALNVSRNSLREALRTLEIMNYVEIRPGEGVYIKKIRMDDLLEPVTSAISLDKGMIMDLLDVRDVIEVEMAKRAAIFATSDDIERIGKALEDSREAIEAGETGLEEDGEFHMAIAQATHNEAFVMMMNLIKGSLTLSQKATLQIKGQPRRTLKDHVKVYEAIRMNDPEMAMKHMKEHILKAKENIIRLNNGKNMDKTDVLKEFE
ncbi:MAG: FadR family transcriptional regulator [Tindallia sp. MSAO_Bac2]|nr:MAG: FadR family transcriptional regulator [Tindallia sp. MSAO_Bac2]